MLKKCVLLHFGSGAANNGAANMVPQIWRLEVDIVMEIS